VKQATADGNSSLPFPFISSAGLKPVAVAMASNDQALLIPFSSPANLKQTNINFGSGQQWYGIRA